MTLDQKIDRTLLLLERLAKESRPKETWVSVSFITSLTGWNTDKLRQARDQGLIKRRKHNGSFEYLLESLHDKFIVKRIGNEVSESTPVIDIKIA